MAKINEEMREVLEGSMWVLATADKNGVPNAVPIHFTKVLGENQLMLVDNFMKKTKVNIEANPHVSISVWKKSVGFQFKGIAKIETSGAHFDAGVEMVKKATDKFVPKGVVVVDLDDIYITTSGKQAGEKVE
ncbi:MAG: pyridoxamine 5'-phosphate oxidase family protein [Bacillota bacterium]|nr:pyridoxamine 5'-phosphate oxidase family protein [Bacillota bacterium]